MVFNLFKAVCSIAGLCNNAAIDKMLEDLSTESLKVSTDEAVVAEKPKKDLTCDQCYNIGSQITKKFQNADRDDILENMLRICGRFSSLSDGCANIVLTYFNDIYDHFSTNLNADNLCHMSGVCAGRYHQHEEKEVELEIRPKSNVGFINVKDDIPCELCEQLVRHLK